MILVRNPVWGPAVVMGIVDLMDRFVVAVREDGSPGVVGIETAYPVLRWISRLEQRMDDLRDVFRDGIKVFLLQRT